MHFRISEITPSNQNSVKVISDREIALEHFPTIVFELPNLERLHISNSKINNIPEDISKISKLTELFLESNAIEYISSSIEKLERLKKLRLYNNKLTDITPVLRISSLQKLELGRNLFIYVPENIGKLINLRYLDLGNIFYKNKIVSLPDTLGRLKKLEYLSVCGGNLPTLGSFIGNLISLKKLIVRDSGVMGLEFNFSLLKNLKVLDLSNNLLTSIPDSITESTNLEEIYFDGNPIRRFPNYLEKLTKLKYLGLAGASLKKSELDYLRVMLPNVKIVTDKSYFVEQHEKEINQLY